MRALLVLAALLALAASSVAHAGPRQAEDPLPARFAYPEVGLTVGCPPLDGIKHRDRPTEEMLGIWTGEFEGLKVQVKLAALSRARHGFNEPEDLLDELGGSVTKIPNYRFRDVELLRGEFGYAPYLAVAEAPLRSGTRETGYNYLVAGILEQRAYYLWLAVTPPPSKEQAVQLKEWLVGAVSYEGKLRDHEWSDEEALERWVLDAPDRINNKKEFEDIIRTEHYIILSNASGGKAFAKKMEECYRAVKKTFPFNDVKGRGLMPVFLFQTNEQYYEFCMKQFGWSHDDAAKSKGVASGDFYATWYEAPGDPVHVHEATHQIFKNRLRLGGGGSWFQEGVAEFISEPENSIRNYAKHHAKRDTQTPFEEFVQIQSMLYSAAETNKGGSEASSNYTQAASIIAFLHDSKFGKKNFQEFIHEMGIVPRNDLAKINEVLNKVYGTDVKGLEQEWVEYWNGK